MNSNKVNRWITLGANLGVLVGIILILLELNQNADLMRAQMVQERANHLVAKYDAIIHSEFWPKIAAMQANSDGRDDWVASLSPEDYQRVLYTYYREVNDIRNQHYQYHQGYLPQEIWDAASRGQIMRMIMLAKALNRPDDFKGDTEFQEHVRRIAVEENLPIPDADGH